MKQQLLVFVGYFKKQSGLPLLNALQSLSTEFGEQTINIRQNLQEIIAIANSRIQYKDARCFLSTLLMAISPSKRPKKGAIGRLAPLIGMKTRTLRYKMRRAILARQNIIRDVNNNSLIQHPKKGQLASGN